MDVGVRSSDVRDHVRERIPQAVIWEPQLDWLDRFPERVMIGRLVFADRESIMLGTLGEETEAGHHRESAITGVGADNALVVLLPELLGSPLDRLDAQSEDVDTRFLL